MTWEKEGRGYRHVFSLFCDKYGLWLDAAVHDQESLLALLKPYPSDELEHYPATSKLNSFKYNDPENIKPVAA